MLLSCNNIEKSFGPEVVLSGVSFRLDWHEKLGLVGRNGCGKTTLLRILTGQMEADTGTVNFAKGVRFGYLRQEQMVEMGRTVREEAEDAFAPVTEMEQRLRELEKVMSQASGAALRSVMDEYGLMRDRLDAMGGYAALRDIPQVLRRLGFTDADQDKPTSRLSGGEKTRLALARLLLSGPDVLFLDEPTNHLDLLATEWLEDFLRDFGGAVVLVSHDRYFLDRVVSRIAEIDQSRLSLYTGGFSAYYEQRAARRQQQADEWEREQREIARLTEFYEKWKNTPTKRSQAVMRMRWAERIRTHGTERPAAEARSMRVGVHSASRSGNEVVIVDHLTKRFGDRTLFENVSLLIQRGQRVGIVGPNGAGKSTLVRILLGREAATSGSARFGANVSVGYFAQEASDLDYEATVLENMLEVAEMTPGEARTYLGRFLFSGDDVYRDVGNLSGGEKNKLVLAQLTYLHPNLLILDEPTNHLDIDSREALTETLRGYDGTILLVSHDRYLLNEITTHTIEVADGRATVFEGNYAAFRERKAAAPKPASPPAQSPTDANANPLTAGMNSFQLSRERRRATKVVGDLEKRVAEAEDWLKRIEEALSAPAPGDDVVKLSRDYETAHAEADQALQEWEEAVTYAEGIGATV